MHIVGQGNYRSNIQYGGHQPTNDQGYYQNDFIPKGCGYGRGRERP